VVSESYLDRLMQTSACVFSSVNVLMSELHRFSQYLETTSKFYAP